MPGYPTRTLKISQAQATALPLSISSLGAITENTSYATCVRNGVGDYTITLGEPSKRQLQVLGSMAYATGIKVSCVARSASAIQVLLSNDSAAPADADFDITLLHYNSTDQW